MYLSLEYIRRRCSGQQIQELAVNMLNRYPSIRTKKSSRWLLRYDSIRCDGRVESNMLWHLVCVNCIFVPETWRCCAGYFTHLWKRSPRYYGYTRTPGVDMFRMDCNTVLSRLTVARMSVFAPLWKRNEPDYLSEHTHLKSCWTASQRPISCLLFIYLIFCFSLSSMSQKSMS